MTRQNYLDRMEAFFREHPMEWLDARDLMPIGGTFAFRTRISDCRLKRGMQIDNDLRRLTLENGEVIIKSFYRFVPYQPLGRDASVPAPLPDRLF